MISFASFVMAERVEGKLPLSQGNGWVINQPINESINVLNMEIFHISEGGAVSEKGEGKCVCGGGVSS
jgi:hypothetical protein